MHSSKKLFLCPMVGALSFLLYSSDSFGAGAVDLASVKKQLEESIWLISQKKYSEVKNKCKDIEKELSTVEK